MKPRGFVGLVSRLLGENCDIYPPEAAPEPLLVPRNCSQSQGLLQLAPLGQGMDHYQEDLGSGANL